MVSLLLVTILLGIMEMGLAFKDWLSISSAARAGARVGSAIGQDPNADCAILEAIGADLDLVGTSAVEEVWIFDANQSTGDPTGPKQVYRPAGGSDPISCAGWFLAEGGWGPSERVVSSDDLSLLGIRIKFQHDWVTGFFPFSGNWQDDAIMRMEPKVVSRS